MHQQRRWKTDVKCVAAVDEVMHVGNTVTKNWGRYAVP